MRILKIFDGDYPWDVRVEKIAQSLLGAGHEVRLLCRNQAGRPRREVGGDGMEIVRLPPLRSVLTLPFFFNPVWWHALRAQIREFRPERILVRDLPLAPLAVALGRRAGIPVLADLAEPYPDSLRSQRQFEALRGFQRWIRSPAFAELAERYVVRRVDRALVVCEEAGQRLERQGLPPERWTEVGNTPRLEAFQERGDGAPELERFDGRCLLLFSGLLAGDRGLDVALEALAALEARAPGRFALAIVGQGPKLEPLRRQAETLGLEHCVFLPGFVPHAELPDWISRARIGLLPFHTCPHIDSTLANKLFEYMALGLPVVASDVPPMRRVIEETGAGLLFRPGDAVELARAIEEMASDPATAQERGRSGRDAVYKKYCWRVDETRLLEAMAVR